MNRFINSHWLHRSLLISSFAAGVLLVAPVSVRTQGKAGADIYRDKCAVCHGEDGAGKTAKGKKVKAKDIHETVKTMSVDQMIDIATKGKDPDMDAFGKQFTPAQIRDLVTYYRSLADKK